MPKGRQVRAWVVRRGFHPGIYYSKTQYRKEIKGFLRSDSQAYFSVTAAQQAWEKWRQEQGLPEVADRDLERSLSQPRHLLSDMTVNADSESENPHSDSEESSSSNDNYIPLLDVDELEQGGVELTGVQQRVVEMASQGHSLFLTGGPESGKTVTMKAIRHSIEKKHIDDQSGFPSVEVITATDVGASLIDGKTIYSFAEWTPDTLHKPLDDIFKESSDHFREALEALKVLIIENISIIENHLLERLNLLMQDVLKIPEPFGGKQIILVGDFHQLPPVKPFQFCISCGGQMLALTRCYTCITRTCHLSNYFKLEDKWAFKSDVWKTLNIKNVELYPKTCQEVAGFQDFVTARRYGSNLSDEEWNVLTAEKDMPKHAVSVRLMSLEDKARLYNEQHLWSIESEAVSWNALDQGQRLMPASTKKNMIKYRTSLKVYHHFETNLVLKIGAKVVLLSEFNPDIGLVNGAQGEVVGFKEASISSLKGCWRWIPGMAENAKKFQKRGESNLLPIVLFENGTRGIIHPVTHKSLRGPPNERYLAVRTQIPLTLGWALSLQRSKGMKLEYVQLSSEDITEPGELQVALSTMSKIEGLKLTGIARELMTPDKEVLDFYQNTEWEDLRPKPMIRSFKLWPRGA